MPQTCHRLVLANQCHIQNPDCQCKVVKSLGVQEWGESGRDSRRRHFWKREGKMRVDWRPGRGRRLLHHFLTPFLGHPVLHWASQICTSCRGGVDPTRLGKTGWCLICAKRENIPLAQISNCLLPHAEYRTGHELGCASAGAACHHPRVQSVVGSHSWFWMYMLSINNHFLTLILLRSKPLSV